MRLRSRNENITITAVHAEGNRESGPGENVIVNWGSESGASSSCPLSWLLDDGVSRQELLGAIRKLPNGPNWIERIEAADKQSAAWEQSYRQARRAEQLSS